MHDDSGEERYRRESERQFLRSVRAATALAFEEAAWEPPENAYIVLARELRDRGIDPEPDAVFAAAMLISRGIEPPVMRSGADG